MRYLILAGTALLALSQNANALFDDEEARKKINELQQQVQTQNQANQTTLAELKKTQEALDQRLAAIEAVVKGQGLIDLLNQVEHLNQELSRMKGQLEVATHNIEMGQQRQRDLYTDIDGRLRKIEAGGAAPAPAPAAGIPPDAPSAVNAVPPGTMPPATAGPVTATVAPTLAPPDASAGSEAKDFEAAQELYKAGKYKDAFTAYEKFLQAYPNSPRAPDAQYALGYTQFSLKNYKASMTTQQKLVKQYPDHPRVPEAMFNIANSQIQLSDVEGAKKTLRTLLSQYPNSDVAPNAKKRLAVLDSIKSR